MRLLLVENQKSPDRTLMHGLEVRGYAVELARSAVEGSAKAKRTEFDVIVVSVASVHGDGLAHIQRWRREGITANVFVITPRSRLRDEMRCLDLGADAYLTTPYEPEELFARLRALVRRNGQVPRSNLQVHDLEIDTTARVVRRQGRPIHLTPREFALLEFLVRRRGKVVTRSTIWSNLYDYHDGGSSNVVDVYIRYLRGKIDKGFEMPLIETRYGQGYLVRGD